MKIATTYSQPSTFTYSQTQRKPKDAWLATIKPYGSNVGGYSSALKSNKQLRRQNNDVKSYLHYKTALPIAAPKPPMRYNGTSEISNAPKSTRVDTSSFLYNMGFFTNPQLSLYTNKIHDDEFLSDPRLQTTGPPRTNFRDIIPLNRNTLSPSFLGAQTGMPG